MWTRFMDMHSGGGSKEKWELIFIEAPEREAEIIFYNRFGHNPHRVTCSCCGNDYSITESDTLQNATAYDRGCKYGYINNAGEEVTQKEAYVSGKGLKDGYSSGYIEKADPSRSYKPYIPLSKYVKDKSVLIIYEADIKPEERIGELPEQGYVWID